MNGYPLEPFAGVAWDTYCPVSSLGQHIGEQVVTCGLVVEERTFHQVTDEPMKFLTLADWTAWWGGVVCRHLPKLRFGHGALLGPGGDDKGGTVRGRAEIYAASIARKESDADTSKAGCSLN